jgi:hypothetical protein
VVGASMEYEGHNRLHRRKPRKDKVRAWSICAAKGASRDGRAIPWSPSTCPC